MKLANPLHYPLAVLAGGIVLVAGGRWLQLPQWLVIPAAVGTTLAAATGCKSREPVTLNLDNPELERALLSTRQAATHLSQSAAKLKPEAARMLTASFQLELLAAVQLGCDRALELPTQVDQLAQRLQGSQAILTVDHLQHQLAEAQQKLRSSSGLARHHLAALTASLQHNLQLAQDGQDTRLAQVISLSTLIQNSAGLLQKLQTNLMDRDLNNPQQLQELQHLSDGLLSLQENVELLIQK